jgi:hypothetical protein
MHHAVENPERFPAFWRAPQNGQAHAGNNPLNQVAALSVEIDVLEANEANAALDGTTRQPICSPGIIGITLLVPRLSSSLSESSQSGKILSGGCFIFFYLKSESRREGSRVQFLQTSRLLAERK